MAAHAFGGGALEVVPERPQVHAIFAGLGQFRAFVDKCFDVPVVFTIYLHVDNDTTEQRYCQLSLLKSPLSGDEDLLNQRF